MDRDNYKHSIEYTGRDLRPTWFRVIVALFQEDKKNMVCPTSTTPFIESELYKNIYKRAIEWDLVEELQFTSDSIIAKGGSKITFINPQYVSSSSNVIFFIEEP